jgi:alanyl-tRNA synthetase
MIVTSSQIIDGSVVFNMVDRHGLPIMVINSILRRKSLGFDVIGFIAAARVAGWKDRTIRTTLLDDLLSPDAVARVKGLLPDA